MDIVQDNQPIPDIETAKLAVELIKQIIALASGVLALSATFIQRISSISWVAILLLGISWILLLISIGFGLNTISTIIGSHLYRTINWSSGKGKVSAEVSKWAFFGGISVFILFALILIIQDAIAMHLKAIPK